MLDVTSQDIVIVKDDNDNNDKLLLLDTKNKRLFSRKRILIGNPPVSTIIYQKQWLLTDNMRNIERNNQYGNY